MATPDDAVQKRLEADGWQVLWDKGLAQQLLSAGAALPSVDCAGVRWPFERAAIAGRAYYAPCWFVVLRVRMTEAQRAGGAIDWANVFSMAKAITNAPVELQSALDAAWRIGGWEAFMLLLDELLVEETRVA